MENQKEDAEKRLPIERFKHFKGIQLSGTGQYFCCDFYEIVHPDSTITYRISADTPSEKLSTEIYLDGESWRSQNKALPEELEQRLIEIIEDTFYDNGEVSSEPLSNPVNKNTTISRLKKFLLRKLHLMKPSNPGSKRILPIIIITILLFSFGVFYAIYLECSGDQYILPYGYTGIVTITYDQKNGLAPVAKDGQRQFYIPYNGILATQCEYQRSKARQFYFLMPDSSLQLITQGQMVGPAMTLRTSTDDSFSVGDVNVIYVDSLNAHKAVFTVTK